MRLVLGWIGGFRTRLISALTSWLGFDPFLLLCLGLVADYRLGCVESDCGDRRLRP